MIDFEAAQVCFEHLKNMDRGQLETAVELIVDRFSELAMEGAETIAEQHALLLEAADVLALDGRLPNLPHVKEEWANGKRLMDRRGYWTAAEKASDGQAERS